MPLIIWSFPERSSSHPTAVVMSIDDRRAHADCGGSSVDGRLCCRLCGHISVDLCCSWHHSPPLVLPVSRSPLKKLIPLVFSSLASLSPTSPCWSLSSLSLPLLAFVIFSGSPHFSSPSSSQVFGLWSSSPSSSSSTSSASCSSPPASLCFIASGSPLSSVFSSNSSAFHHHHHHQCFCFF